MSLTRKIVALIVITAIAAGLFVSSASAKISGTSVGRSVLKMKRPARKTEEQETKAPPAEEEAAEAQPEPVEVEVAEEQPAPIEPAPAPVKITPAPRPTYTKPAATKKITTRTDDKLLEILPKDSIAYIRINNFDATINALDQYLMGLSPLPLGMTIKMQLPQMVGDPTLSTVDTTGDFAIMFSAAPSQTQGQPEVTIYMLVPLKSKPTAGPLAENMIGNSHSLVPLLDNGARLDQTKLNITKSSLSSTMDDAEYEKATSSQIWIHANMPQINSDFGQMLKQSLQMGNMMLASSMASDDSQATATFVNAMGSIFFSSIEKFLDQSDSVSVSLNVTPQTLAISKTITPISGSEFADMLNNNQSSDSSMDLAKYISKPAAGAFLTNINMTSLQTIVNTSIDMIAEASPEDMPNAKAQELKAYLTKLTDNLEGNFASAAIPVENQQTPNTTFVAKVKNAEKTRQLIAEGSEHLSYIYQKMLPGSKITYTKDTDVYKNLPIDTVNFKLNFPDDANSQGQPAKESVETEYKIAFNNNIMFVQAGQDVMADLKKNLDTPASAAQASAGRLNNAIKACPYAENACYLGYYDILSTMKYVEMSAQNQNDPAMAMMASLFNGVNLDSKSSMAISGNISNGKIALDLSLPKEHLLEVFAAGMQIKQNTMAAKNAMGMGQPMTMDAPQSSSSMSSRSAPQMYRCPMHSKSVNLQPGKCSQCGMDMVPIK